jgi:hypothetical protein
MNPPSRASYCLALAFLLAGAYSASAADPLRYVPNGSDVVVSLNVDGLLGTPVVQLHLPALLSRHGSALLRFWSQDDAFGKQVVLKNGPALERTLKDPEEVRRSLDQVRRTWTHVVLAGRFNGNEDEVLVVVECPLDAEKLPAFLKAMSDWTGSRVKPAGGGDAGLTEIQIPGEEDSWFLALVEKGILVLSPSRDYVREALAKAAGKQQADLNKSMSAVLQQVDRKQTGWLAIVDSREDLGIRGGFTLAEECKAEIVITALSEQAAKDQLEQVQADLTKARAYLEDCARKTRAAEPLVELVRAAKVAREGKRISVSLELDANQLQQLLKTPSPEPRP